MIYEILTTRRSRQIFSYNLYFIIHNYDSHIYKNLQKRK